MIRFFISICFFRKLFLMFDIEKIETMFLTLRKYDVPIFAQDYLDLFGWIKIDSFGLQQVFLDEDVSFSFSGYRCLK